MTILKCQLLANVDVEGKSFAYASRGNPALAIIYLYRPDDTEK